MLARWQGRDDVLVILPISQIAILYCLLAGNAQLVLINSK